LTVIAIIAIMVGVLIPAVTYVRNSANVARQKAQFAAIAMALDAFKGDYGDYPPSTVTSFAGYNYCGANMLCEALVGWDLLGFDPNSNWNGDWTPYQGCASPPCDLQGRLGPYLEMGTTSAFKLSQLFPGTLTNLNTDRYVLCDSFGAKSVTVGGKTVKAGRPILYYKANVANKAFGPQPPSNGTDPTTWIYNFIDNIDLINLQVNFETFTLNNPSYKPDPLYNSYGGGLPGTYLYSPSYKLLDQKVYSATGGAVPWPYRPDSYILISAGVDGVYGTDDDITNF
jgi:type II secretory pathway pseudopilin PulG